MPRKIDFPAFRAFRILSAAAVLGIAACAGSDPHPMPMLTFEHIAPAPINVARISVSNEAAPSEVAFVVSPQNAMEEYLNRRFAAQGLEGELRGVIEEAQVSEAHKPSDSKVGNFFGVAGFDEYNVTVRLRLEWVDQDGIKRYSNVLAARRTMRITEHASVAEREKHQIEGLEILFRDIDREAQRIVLRDMNLGL